jgi:hypothetical protein
MQKSLCILSNRFELNDDADITHLHKILTALPKAIRPINLIDKQKYLKHLWQHDGIMHFDQKDIFQINASDLYDQNLSTVFDNSHQLFLDEGMQIEFNFNSLTWLIFLDTKNNYGLLINIFELTHYSDTPLNTLANTKTFRYFKEPGNSDMYKLKIVRGHNNLNVISLFSLFSKSCIGVTSEINFINPKPIQFHFFDKVIYHNEHEKESLCYNILRIPGEQNKQAEEKYLQRSLHHYYENSSIYVFAMNEGAIVMSPYKSPRQLFPNFFPAIMLVLLQKELIHHLFASQSQIINLHSLIQNSKSMLNKFKKFRDVIHLTNYYFSLPISQYTEIQDVFIHLKRNLSGFDADNLSTSISELTSVIQEAAEKESSQREKNIGVFLGVLGITGFISFIFDFFFISKNQKLLDSLDFPLNLLPIFIFVISFFLIWRVINKNLTDD